MPATLAIASVVVIASMSGICNVVRMYGNVSCATVCLAGSMAVIDSMHVVAIVPTVVRMNIVASGVSS